MARSIQSVSFIAELSNAGAMGCRLGCRHSLQ